jgi:hypothetical protein
MQNPKPNNPFSKEKIILMCAATLLGVLVTFSGSRTENDKQYLYNRTVREDSQQTQQHDLNSQESEQEDDEDLSQETERDDDSDSQENESSQERRRNEIRNGFHEPGGGHPYSGEAGLNGIFTDIPFTHPDAAALQYLKDNGIMKGYPDGSFKPDKAVNRAEVIKIIVKALGEPKNLNEHKKCFKDMNEEWFAPYGCYAKWKGWVKGYNDGGYHPSNDVTRAELLKMVIEAYGITLETAPPSTSAFASLNTDTWSTRYVWTAEANGLMTAWGNNTPDNLNQPATRLEVATAIYTLMFEQQATI